MYKRNITPNSNTRLECYRADRFICFAEITNSGKDISLTSPGLASMSGKLIDNHTAEIYLISKEVFSDDSHAYGFYPREFIYQYANYLNRLGFNPSRVIVPIDRKNMLNEDIRKLITPFASGRKRGINSSQSPLVNNLQSAYQLPLMDITEMFNLSLVDISFRDAEYTTTAGLSEYSGQIILENSNLLHCKACPFLHEKGIGDCRLRYANSEPDLETILKRDAPVRLNSSHTSYKRSNESIYNQVYRVRKSAWTKATEWVLSKFGRRSSADYAASCIHKYKNETHILGEYK